MQIIIMALVAGILLGRLIAPRGHQKLISRFTIWGVMALLFIMGAQIGTNDSVLHNLPRLGGQALVIALLCSLGSVLVSLPLGGRDK